MEALMISGAINLASRVSASMKTPGVGVGQSTYQLMQNKSLVDVASPARVEPITMVDADCIHMDELGDIMQSLQSMFAGYYLQAVNMMGTIGGVSIANKLAPLNPNRGLGFESLAVEARKAVSMEEYRFRLPLSSHSRTVALESQANNATGDKAIESVKEAANLSIGKMYNVTLTHENVSATIPISIRLMVNVIPTRMMVELFTQRDTFDMDMKERYHAWKSGRLEFVKDLILCNDLIDKRRRGAVRDNTGILQTIQGREAQNIVSGMLNGRASVATSSNLAVLSSDTLGEIELSLNGKLSNAKVRSALFASTNLMILAVVDKGWARVEFYTRGLDSSTSLSFKDLRGLSKSGGGSEVLDIMKAYMAGNSPSA